MRVGSICSGIGGIDYAFAAAGFEISYQVESDEFCKRVLRKHFRSAKRYGDIFGVDVGDLPAVDVICAGFPCQPFSEAGKRRGPDDERFLWPELLRIIAAHYPAVVFLENVSGLRTNDGGNTFKRILRELADVGYVVEWDHIRTGSEVGAPHHRERVFIVAYATGKRCPQSPEQCRRRKAERGRVLAYAYSRCSRPAATRSRPYPRNTKWDSALYQRERRTVIHASRSGGEIRKPPGRKRLSKSGMGSAAHGLSRRLVRHQFPSGQGQEQYPFEHPRTVGEKVENHSAQIKAYGNAVVPQAVYPLAVAIREYLNRVHTGGIAA